MTAAGLRCRSARLPRGGGHPRSEMHQNSTASPPSLASPALLDSSHSATRARPSHLAPRASTLLRTRRAGLTAGAADCGTAGATASDLYRTLRGPLCRGFRTMTPGQQGGNKAAGVASRSRGRAPRGRQRRDLLRWEGGEEERRRGGRRGGVGDRPLFLPPLLTHWSVWVHDVHSLHQTHSIARVHESVFRTGVDGFDRHRGPTRSGRSDLLPIASATRGGAPRPATLSLSPSSCGGLCPGKE